MRIERVGLFWATKAVGFHCGLGRGGPFSLFVLSFLRNYQASARIMDQFIDIDLVPEMPQVSLFQSCYSLI